MIFIDLITVDSTSDMQISVNKLIRQFVIPDEELKPVLPKVRDILRLCVYRRGLMETE